MLSRVSGLLDPRRSRATLDLAGAVLQEASRRVPARDIFYLEVTEADNARRSFDINVYRAGIRLRERAPDPAAPLVQMSRHVF